MHKRQSTISNILVYEYLYGPTVCSLMGIYIVKLLREYPLPKVFVYMLTAAESISEEKFEQNQ